MIYKWTIPEKYKNRYIGEYDRDHSPDSYWLTKGMVLGEFIPTPHVYFETSKQNIMQFDCLPNNSLIPLVNERVKTLLEKLAAADVQFFPAKITCTDGTLDGYFFLNITHLILGIDHKKSVYTKMTTVDAISGFHYLTYKPDCMGEHDLARDQEYESHLLVSEKIKNVFDREKISGVSLIRPEDCYHGPLTVLDLINEERAIEEEKEEDD